ncbi:MAG: peptidoglycan DD-metalloendopeptidase family protein [Oscillospiraceae bacterium]|nr:peptidoglycan DD-metalloendopeptidase family protein [Oscillospiraceae bacterium]
MTLLQMSISGAVMILVTAAVRTAFIRRLPKRTFTVMWWIVLARLLVPYSLPSAFSVYSLLARTDTAAEKPGIAPPYIPDISAPPLYGTLPDHAAPAPPPPAPVHSPAAPVLSPAAAAPMADIPTLIWAIGLLACTAFFMLSYLKSLRKFGESLPVDNNEYISQWLAEHRLFRRITVRQSDMISAPLTYGIFRPVILLPKKIAQDSSDDLKYVLSHEYIHIRRFDLVFKLVLTAALCIHWFDPLVWVMYVLANRDIEISCDEAVIRMFGEQKKSDYAMALIRMEEKKSGLAPLVPHYNKSPIEERIVTIMKFKKTTAFAAATSVLLVLGTTAAFATSAKPQNNDPEPPTVSVPIDDNNSSDSSAPESEASNSADTSTHPTAENKALSPEEWAKRPLVLPSKFAPEDLDFVNTTNGWINSHNTTIYADRGSEVYAVDDGEVIFADYHNAWNYGMGSFVAIKHAEGLFTIYSHLLSVEENSEEFVSAGDQVKAGQCIGLAGISGNIRDYGFSYGFRTELPEYIKELTPAPPETSDSSEEDPAYLNDPLIPPGEPVTVEERIGKNGKPYKVFYIGWDEDDTEHKGSRATAMYADTMYVYRLEGSDAPAKPVEEREYSNCVNDGQVIIYW